MKNNKKSNSEIAHKNAPTQDTLDEQAMSLKDENNGIYDFENSVANWMNSKGRKH